MCCMINQSHVATCSKQNVVRIYNLDDDAFVELIGHKLGVNTICYREGHLISGSRDCETRVWDVETL